LLAAPPTARSPERVSQSLNLTPVSVLLLCVISKRTGNVLSLPLLCAGYKTAGQDVSLEYRRHAKASRSGFARHPDKVRRVEIFRSLNPTPSAYSQRCLTAWPTPHGRTVNCAPVHRYPMGSVPEIPPWLQHPPETVHHSLPCIAMQPRTNDEVPFSSI